MRSCYVCTTVFFPLAPFLPSCPLNLNLSLSPACPAPYPACPGGIVLPMRYRHVEIKVQPGAHAFEEFDFSFYNRTRFAGLENGFPNCFVNALLQVRVCVAGWGCCSLCVGVGGCCSLCVGVGGCCRYVCECEGGGLLRVYMCMRGVCMCVCMHVCVFWMCVCVLVWGGACLS